MARKLKRPEDNPTLSVGIPDRKLTVNKLYIYIRLPACV
jgi:hypothetical protein